MIKGNKRFNKKRVLILVIIFVIILPVLYWLTALTKCEVLTLIHGKEFSEIYRENTMIGDIDYLKVLEYSDTTASVYYVTKNKGSANIIKFSGKNGEWNYDSWETVWSNMGSASDVVWPYWWHFIYGGF